MAVIHQSGLGAVYILQESSFCTIDGTLGNFTPVPAIRDGAMAVTLEEPVEEPGHVGQRLDDSAEGVLMPKRATYPLIIPMETFTTKAASGVQAALHWGAMLFGAILGGVYRSTGTTINGAGSTTTVLPFTSAATHRAGGAVGLVDPSTGLMHMREIASISANNVTLKMALPFTPANAAVVYGATSCYLHNHPDGAEPTYLQTLIFGYNQYERFQLPGGTAASLKFSGFGPSGFPQAEIQMQYPTWLDADSTNGTVNSMGTTLGEVTYTNTIANTVRDSDCRLRPYGSSALSASTLVQATELDIEPTVEWEMLPSPNGPFSSNVRGARRKDSRDRNLNSRQACRVMFREPAEDNKKYRTYHTDRTKLAFTQQVGMSPTRGGFLIAVPKMQSAAPPNYTDLSAVRGVGVTLASMKDTETTAAGGASAADIALASAALRIHFI